MKGGRTPSASFQDPAFQTPRGSQVSPAVSTQTRRRHVLGFGEVVGVDDVYPLLERRSVISHQVADEISFEMCCRLSRPVGAMGHSWVQGAHPHSGKGEKCLLTVGKPLVTGPLHTDSALTRGGGDFSLRLHLVSRDPHQTQIPPCCPDSFHHIQNYFWRPHCEFRPIRSSLCPPLPSNPPPCSLSSSHHTFFLLLLPTPYILLSEEWWHQSIVLISVVRANPHHL